MSIEYLKKASKTAASGEDEHIIFDRILTLLQQQFKFDLCVIRIHDPVSNTLVVRSQQGMTSRHLGESERNLDMTTCIGEAYLTNREIVINDTMLMDKKISAEIARREGIVSLAHPFCPIGP